MTNPPITDADRQAIEHVKNSGATFKRDTVIYTDGPDGLPRLIAPDVPRVVGVNHFPDAELDK